jgi:ATP-dependent Clp protease adaptor protein ClpS
MATQNEHLLDFEISIDSIRPNMYRVILHNDNYSTFDFVVDVLMEIFHKSHEEAGRLTMQVDKEGLAIVGIYTKDIAEMKVAQVAFKAKNRGYPLRATFEEDE